MYTYILVINYYFSQGKMIYINNNGIVPRAKCAKGRHRSKSTTRDAKQFEAPPTPKNNYK